MKKINDASIQYRDKEGNNIEKMMFTYDEAERQENEINKANAKLIFTPEFIPFYLDVVQKYNLNSTEALIYGFIRFYISTGKNKRFYFSNNHLAVIFNCSESMIKKSIPTLEKHGLIKSSRKIKSGGGTMRFITSVNRCLEEKRTSEVPSIVHSEVPSTELQEFLPRNLHIKENKIKENKIKETLLRKEADAYGNPQINDLIIAFEKIMGFPSSGKKDRWMAKHLLRNFTIEQLKGMMLYCSKYEYAPRIGSIEKLWFKRGDIIAGIKSLKNKSSKTMIKFIS